MKNKKDFFETINNFPHTLAIYFTFTLDTEVINKIADNSSGNIIIFHDYRQGVYLEKKWENRVICLPVITKSKNIKSLFHSKLALLKGNEEVKLLLGSANLTQTSFVAEKELCLETNLPFESKLLESILDYIESIFEYTCTSTKILTNLLRKYRFEYPKKIDHKGFSFINNSDEASIANKICSHLKQNEQPILKIASPFLSKSYKNKLSDFLKCVNPKEIHLYLRDNLPLPKELNKFNTIKIFKPKTKSTRVGFHAKLVSIEYSKKQVVYIGSANFTQNGFFFNLKNGANHECGVIISSRKKHILDDWFNVGWEKPVSMNEWYENESLLEQNQDESKNEPYVWAETSLEKETTLFFYIPNKELLKNIKAEGKKIVLKPKDEKTDIYCFYNFKTQKSVIRIQIGSNEHEIIIFNEDKFEQIFINSSDSIFSSTENIKSVHPLTLRSGIEKEGLKLKTSGAIIVEPPYLEKYFHNVKTKINLLSNRKNFSLYNLYNKDEFEKHIENLTGGEGIYYLLQLLKCFENKEIKHKVYINMCREKALKLLSETQNIKISPSKFNSFLNKWKKL